MLKSGNVVLIGTGFVADLYMRSFEQFPQLKILCAFDIDQARLNAFCAFWSVPPAASLDAALTKAVNDQAIVVNLTNPKAHFDVSMAALEAGCHVYSEKPLACEVGEAETLVREAESRNLFIGSAPCSWLSTAAQTIKSAVAAEVMGKARLAYAEMDDGFVPAAPYKKWISESGAPWPWADEFNVGCTLEHAGYYLTWLMDLFGPVKTVVAASDEVIDGKIPGQEETAPDVSIAVLKFHSGLVARLSCSIVATHDHGLRIFCDDGIVGLNECWDNHAPVWTQRRHRLRRRLIESPFKRKVKPIETDWPKAKRRGSASMNFALGIVDMLSAVENNTTPRITAAYSLHLTEVTLAIQNSGWSSGAIAISSTF